METTSLIDLVAGGLAVVVLIGGLLMLLDISEIESNSEKSHMIKI